MAKNTSFLEINKYYSDLNLVPNLVIDGNNLLCRNLFSDKNTVNKLHQHTGGYGGFIRSMISMANPIKGIRFNEIHVTFDKGGSVKRRNLDKNYKANRNISSVSSWITSDGIEIDQSSAFSRQQNLLMETFEELGISCYQLEFIEADDVIYYLSRKHPSVIISEDTDFLQCINRYTSVYFPRKKQFITKNNFQEQTQYPFKPDQYSLLKSIVGDKGDNITGVRGIGWKKVLKILEECPDLSADNLDSCSSKIVLDNLSLIEKNYKLIHLNLGMISTNAKKTIDAIYTFEPLKPNMRKFMKMCLAENVANILTDMRFASMISINHKNRKLNVQKG